MLTEEQRADLPRAACRPCAPRSSGRLVQRIDGGDIALLGRVGAAIATLDATPPPIEAAAEAGLRT